MVRVSARAEAARCVPPSTVLMLFAKLKSVSAYPSLYWSAISIADRAARARLLAFDVDRLFVQDASCRGSGA